MPKFDLPISYSTGDDDGDLPEIAVIRLSKLEIEAVLHYMGYFRLVRGAANLAFQPSGIIVQLDQTQWDCEIYDKEDFAAHLLIEENRVSLNFSRGQTVVETEPLDKEELENALPKEYLCELTGYQTGAIQFEDKNKTIWVGDWTDIKGVPELCSWWVISGDEISKTQRTDVPAAMKDAMQKYEREKKMPVSTSEFKAWRVNDKITVAISSSWKRFNDWRG